MPSKRSIYSKFVEIHEHVRSCGDFGKSVTCPLGVPFTVMSIEVRTCSKYVTRPLQVPSWSIEILNHVHRCHVHTTCPYRVHFLRQNPSVVHT